MLIIGCDRSRTVEFREGLASDLMNAHAERLMNSEVHLRCT